VFYVFLALATVIVLVFAYVAFSTKTSRDVEYEAASRVRKRFFIVLTGALVVALALTLPRTAFTEADAIAATRAFAAPVPSASSRGSSRRAGARSSDRTTTRPTPSR